jgi:hypothetical protein
MAVNTVFYIKQGDLLPRLRGRIFDAVTGDGQDLTGATLEFHMSNADTGEVLISAPADVDLTVDQTDPAEGGWWIYEWQAGDTGPYSEPGVDETLTFNGEIQATFAGKPLTSPNNAHFKIKMRNELD